MNTNFNVNSLTRLGTKPQSTDPAADALTTRPSELLMSLLQPSEMLSNIMMHLSLNVW